MNSINELRTMFEDFLIEVNYPKEKLMEVFDKIFIPELDEDNKKQKELSIFDNHFKYRAILDSFKKAINDIPFQFVKKVLDYTVAFGNYKTDEQFNEIESVYSFIDAIRENTKMILKDRYYLTLANYSIDTCIDKHMVHLVNVMGKGDIFVTFNFKMNFAKRIITYNIYSINSKIETVNKGHYIDAITNFFQEYTKRIWKDSIEIVGFNLLNQ